MSVRVWVWVLVVSSGCYSRVQLTPPSETGPSAQWEQFEITGVRTQALVLMRGPATPERLAAVDLDGVVLRNETVVEDPRDLRPLVLPDSRTAELATKWGVGNERWAGLQVAAGASLGTGLAFAFITLFSSAVPGARLAPEIGAPMAFSALPLIAIVPPLCALIGALWVGKIDQLRLDAFASYPADLSARRDRAPEVVVPPSP